MLVLLSDLITAERVDVDENGEASISGYQGSWVMLDTSANLKLTDGPTALAWPIWNESAVLGETSAGFAPDVAETGKLTVLKGLHRALTNQYTGSPAIGDKLYTTDPGVLKVAPDNDTNSVAVCTAAPASVIYRGTTFTCIEYETI